MKAVGGHNSDDGAIYQNRIADSCGITEEKCCRANIVETQGHKEGKHTKETWNEQ